MTNIANLEQTLIETVRSLPPEQQQEVLDFAEFLRQKTTSKQPRRSLKGLWADFDVQISEEDITEARQEMWGNFPREFPE
ncbi:DUF2281 domain-containing protein [Cyanobacteria bacterium FACHB-DQ100]|nr:DUF2281 domain-containing protein [Cyanobacteria bacterium FACHB-DQ100]